MGLARLQILSVMLCRPPDVFAMHLYGVKVLSLILFMVLPEAGNKLFRPFLVLGQHAKCSFSVCRAQFAAPSKQS